MLAKNATAENFVVANGSVGGNDGVLYVRVAVGFLIVKNSIPVALSSGGFRVGIVSGVVSAVRVGGLRWPVPWRGGGIRHVSETISLFTWFRSVQSVNTHNSRVYLGLSALNTKLKTARLRS